MSIQDEYVRWSDNVFDDPELKQDLIQIWGNSAEIKDRFYRDLEFGTGGMRGKTGAGTNRMSVYTVGKATQGLASYLCKYFAFPKVCIAYDTRHKSAEFAERAAQVLCANGITVFMFEDARPTPMLSYAVRQKNASAGIVITASHNPREYNGYKVYNAYGGQITDHDALEISRYIETCDIFEDVKSMPLRDAAGAGLLKMLGEETDAAYSAAVRQLVMRKDLVKSHAGDLKIIYTPLNGTGSIPVRRVLAELGYSQVHVVKEQEYPDGDFPTTPCPNPEEPAVFHLALKLAERVKPDLIFATDPDCDRIGVMAPTDSGEFFAFTGNQIGALLCDYVLRTKNELGSLPAQPAVIKTVVTSDLGKHICAKANVAMAEVLTGFKYIGELAEQWEQRREHSFLFGYEESCGYLTGNFVRDKDAVIAASLIAEMALYYKGQGMTLNGALINLLDTYGYYSEKLIAVEMAGSESREKITRIIENLRVNYTTLLQEDLSVFEDYQQSIRVSAADSRPEPIALPKADMLKFVFADGSWLALRPSGTEPKIKIYISAAGLSRKAAEDRLLQLESVARRILS